jgi:hypothetical protein
VSDTQKPFIIDIAYAIAHLGATQPAAAGYFSFLLLFVFSLCERKNEKQNELGLALVDQIQPLVYHFCPCGAKMIHNKDKNTMLPQANAL